MLQAKDSGIVASAASAEAATNEESISEFAKNDNRRLLHVVYRVGDLDKTIKYSAPFSPLLMSRNECFEMTLLVCQLLRVVISRIASTLHKSLKVIFSIALLTLFSCAGFTQNVWE